MQHLLTNTEGALPRGAGLPITWTTGPAITKPQGKLVFSSCSHILQPFQSPPRATKRSCDLRSTTCPLGSPGPLARL